MVYTNELRGIPEEIFKFLKPQGMIEVRKIKRIHAGILKDSELVIFNLYSILPDKLQI